MPNGYATLAEYGTLSVQSDRTGADATRILKIEAASDYADRYTGRAFGPRVNIKTGAIQTRTGASQDISRRWYAMAVFLSCNAYAKRR